ncbi:hypothetical protein NDU88_004669 [Pleurodeles waltl]|uniref:Uncharacterized protein n=1 Tax=Pleurodeles waltl TaxID=8319 RepID=A0AAV7T8K6_PLEWA|nr:hypothetical protein NDU88_004669 [Pleurodeles waltl]
MGILASTCMQTYTEQEPWGEEMTAQYFLTASGPGDPTHNLYKSNIIELHAERPRTTKPQVCSGVCRHLALSPTSCYDGQEPSAILGWQKFVTDSLPALVTFFKKTCPSETFPMSS